MAGNTPAMTFSDLSIKNRAFAVMLSAAMLIFGYLGYKDMGISQFPELDFPVVTVTTTREAASPETMDFDVTDIIEDAVSSVEGIDYIQSQSIEGSSTVTIYFHLHRDVDVAMQDVQNAVSAAMHRLPTDIDPPNISKVNFNKFPVMWLSVTGHRPQQEISKLVETQLKQQIESIPGVGGVWYGGLRSRNMRIWLDGKKLHAHNLDALDVMRAMRAEHVEKPAGYLQSDLRELNVRTMGEARTAAEFRRLPLATRDGQVIRVEDVAVVEDGMSDRRGFSRFNREPNVGMGVMRATGANVVAVCDEVKRRLPGLRAQLPPGVEIGISTDYSLFIKDDIDEVQLAMLYGILLTAVVTFLFLGSVGTTCNVCISIPTSLLGTFVAMKICGFTINFMTLLGLSLSVGVVVDDAILVLENIYRRMELGEKRLAASLHGANEISFAAIAATLSIVAIFIPIAFLKGAIGRFFFQFAITVSVAVMLSLVISLTITPMLCSLFLRVRHPGRPRPAKLGGTLGGLVTPLVRLHWFLDRWVLELLLVRPFNRLMDLLTRLYGGVLRVSLRHQGWVVAAGILLAASAYLFAYGVEVPLPGPLAAWHGEPRFTIKPVGRELVPSEDQNRFVVTVICPVGSSIDYVDEMLQRGEDILVNLQDPHGTHVTASLFAAVSIRPGRLITEGTMFVRLVPAEERAWTQTEVMNEFRQRFGGVAGVRVIVMDLSTQGFSSSRGFPVNFAVQGPNWDTVTRFAERIRARLTENPAIADVNSDYQPGMPEIHLVPDRLKAAEIGVPIQRLAFTVNVAIGGWRNGRFTEGDKRFDVRLRYLHDQRESPDQLADVYVKTDAGGMVPLRDLVRWETVSTLPVIARHNHARKVEITANVGFGYTQGEAVVRAHEIVEEVREEMNLPESYRIVQLGNAQAMQQTIDSLWQALAWGFLVATMILGVQFNSFVHPFTVLMAVPFGVTGALAMLWFAGDTINFMSMVGLVLLAGLVKKNSIILVDYTNQLREHGMGLKEAVLTACPIRLRPILMTSLATMAAAVPLAMGYGAGAETRAPLARSIIGGIALSTLVTLIIVPVFYVLFDRFGAWVRGMTERDEPKGRLPEPSVNGVARPHAAMAVPSVNGEVQGPRPKELEPVLEVRPGTAT